MTDKEILTVVEQKFEEVYDLVYDNMDRPVHNILVGMFDVLEQLKTFSEESQQNG